VKRTEELLQWVFFSGADVNVTEGEDGILSADRPETEEKFRAYFQEGAVLTDLAVLRADVTPAQSQPIHFDTSGNVLVGQQVFPVGAPLGLSDTVSTGIVSNTGRTVRVPADEGRTALLVSALQTDASINPGNSGGTLANCNGDLVGVPTAGATATDSVGGQVGGSIGLGFAISANTAQTVANELLAHGRVTTHSYLGVSVATVSSSPTGPWGLYVTAVSALSPARQAGMHASDMSVYLRSANRPSETLAIAARRSATWRRIMSSSSGCVRA
jgi:putative serine protease PepD